MSLSELTFHMKHRRKRGHGYKPGELKARFWRRWLAFKAKSGARALRRATAHNRQMEASDG